MKTTTPKEKALAKVRAAQKKAEIVSKAFGPPPVRVATLPLQGEKVGSFEINQSKSNRAP